ncbi:MAG: hypothetical protein U1E33_05050 [Rhodospirillales bacterium]
MAVTDEERESIDVPERSRADAVETAEPAPVPALPLQRLEPAAEEPKPPVRRAAAIRRGRSTTPALAVMPAGAPPTPARRRR